MSAALQREAEERFPFKQTDHKAWAKRILYREEKGDKDLLPIQVRFAKTAMDIKDEATA